MKKHSKVREWAIRKLGGYTRDELDLQKSLSNARAMRQDRPIIKLAVTDIMDDNVPRCMPETAANMYMARRLAEKIIEDRLCKMEYEEGKYGTVKRTMTVEIIMPVYR